MKTREGGRNDCLFHGAWNLLRSETLDLPCTIRVGMKFNPYSSTSYWFKSNIAGIARIVLVKQAEKTDDAT